MYKVSSVYQTIFMQPSETFMSYIVILFILPGKMEKKLLRMQH